MARRGNGMYAGNQVTVGVWWRFNRYVIKGGAIRPAPGAILEKSDPWQTFRTAHRGKQDVPEGKRMMDPPYRSLLNLVENKSSSKFSEDDLLDWCARYGLLGILPHRALAVTLPARWRPIDKRPQSTIWRLLSGLQEDDLVPTVDTLNRTNVGWRADRHPYKPAERPESPVLNSIVFDRFLGPDCPRPGAVLQAIGDYQIVQEPLGRTFATFFPDVPECHPFPALLTDNFWRIYAEPIDTFWEGAILLSHSVKALQNAIGKDIALMSKDDQIRFGNAYKGLNALLAGVSPALVSHSPGVLEQKWNSRSLLGSLAMMALLDLTAGYIFSCQNEACGKTFVTSAWQATYCSPRCRNTTLHRDLRWRKQEAAKLRVKRVPVAKIAQQLGVDAETVKKWLKW